MKPVYCLFTITHNTYYTTIQGCEPTDDRALLENIRGEIVMIRKHNSSSTMEILETTRTCALTESGHKRLQEVRASLT
jgi:hypothetical protein